MSMRWTETEMQQYLQRQQAMRVPSGETRAWEVRGAEGATLEPEGKFMARVIALAKQHGYLCYHTHNSKRSEPGFPDLVMTNGHSTLFVELKKNTEKPTADQQRWLDMLGHAGQEIHIWRPRDWEIIAERLSAQACLPSQYGGGNIVF